jgi:hypothetical protein
MNTTQSRFNWPMAITVIAVAVLIAGTTLGWLVMNKVDRVGEFWKPKVSINEQTLITTALGELKKEAKLVVLTTHVSAEVETENEVELKVGPITIPRGKTRVHLRSKVNRVQFVIPREKLTDSSFSFDQGKNELVVRLPQPVADPDMVVIDPNPEIKTEVGWLRLDSRSGEHLRTNAKGMVDEFVLREATKPIYLGAAREAGEAAVKAMLAPALAQLPGNVHLKIEFENPPNQPPG